MPTEEDLSSYYNMFDTIIGIENLEIHYGVVYVEKHRAKTKKTKFFPSPNFTLGHAIIDHMPYYSLNLKYNVYEDELLMKIANKLGGEILRVYKEKVNGFTINGHRFTKIKAPKTGNQKIDPGFYAVLLEKPLFTLLKKHRKLLTDTLGENLVFFEFEDLDPDFVLYYGLDYHKLKRIRDVQAVFPGYTEQLDDFVKTLPPNSNFEDQLKTILVFTNTLLTSEKDKALQE
ncbi:MAG: hypothetical protein AAFX53_02580 [Bacteroidota bacterium]